MKKSLTNRLLHKRGGSFCVILMMLLSTVNAWANWSGAGDGTPDNPYQISSYAQLKEFAAIINDVYNNTPVACAKLTADIVCDDNTWIPISKNKYYTGTFDGQGHTITGLSNAGVSPTPPNAGLFGCVGTGGTIKNVILADATLCGSKFIGGIAGYTDEDTSTTHGIIQNCCLIGASSISSIQSQEFGTGGTGGIVGFNRSTVSACYVAISGSGSISDTGGDKSIGGIVGTNVGTVENCHYSGSGAISTSRVYVNLKIGGVVGYNTGTARYCYYAGTGTISGSEIIGGVIGTNDDTATNCYYNTDNTTVTKAIGNTDDTETVKGLTATQFKDENFLTTYGFSSDNWIQGIIAPLLKGMKYTVSFNANGGTGSMAGQTVTSGDDAVLSSNTFTCGSYLFTGWNTKADGTGVDVPTDAKAGLAGPETLYAQWAPQSGTCGATGNEANVTWILADNDNNDTFETLTISGTGAMAGYDDNSTQPWAAYKSGITTIVIEEGVTQIGYGNFREHTNLTSVTIPASVTTIGEKAFYGCTNLTTVSDANGVNVIAMLDMNWSSLQTLLTNSSTEADNPTVMMLFNDVVAESSDSYLNIPAGHHAIIVLNGHKIDRHMTESQQGGYVIKLDGQSNNHASLVIRDSSNPSTGMITGGFDGTDSGSSAAGGINVQYGDLTLEGGSICGNKCTFEGGGGVRVAAGTFTMTGGSITGNMVNTLQNSVARAGGAIYGYSGDIYLHGGSITGNTTYASSYACGGIAHDYANGAAQLHLNGTFTLSDNHKISYDTSTHDWTTSTASDYLHGNREHIVLDGPVSPTAPIAIDLYSGYNGRLTTNWCTHMGTANPDDCFTLVANSKFFIVKDDNLYIVTPEEAYWHADDDHDGSTEEKAYIITTTDGLDLLASLVNGGNDYSGKYFQLGNDITYTHKAANEAGADTENNFTAIGTESNPFKGIFDGNNKTISGIRIYKPNDSYLGLFGHSDGNIQNVIVSDAVITGTDNIGAIAGSIDNGSIQDCFVINTNVIGHQTTGAIVGIKGNDVSLKDNYYRDCTRTYNDIATTNIGIGSGYDISGALPVFTITTDPDISISGNVAVSFQGVNYYNPYTDITLNYTGSSESFMMPVMDVIPLLNGFDNSRVIADNQGSGKNVILTDRTLYLDNYWNTLCLPFSLDVGTIDALTNYTLMELDTENKRSWVNGGWRIDNTSGTHMTGVDATTGTLYLFFKTTRSITAGTPYLIRWRDAEEIVNPLFAGVTIDNSAEAIARKTVTSADGKVSFKGTYEKILYTEEDKSILFLDYYNELRWPKPNLTNPSNPVYPSIGAFRSYFQLNGITANNIYATRLFFGDDIATSMQSLTPALSKGEGAWYSLDGRKLQGKPTAKGVYIHNGRKTVIK